MKNILIVAGREFRQILGMRLFNQSCRVCHTKPQFNSPLYGPALSRASAGGQDATMRGIISNGTPRMPGFKHQFQPAQIDAIEKQRVSKTPIRVRKLGINQQNLHFFPPLALIPRDVNEAIA